MKILLKNIIFLPALLILFSFQTKQKIYNVGKTLGNLHLSKDKPKPGDTLMLTYHWETDTDENKMEAFFHYFVGQNVYPQDIELSESSGKWKGQLTIPDSATAIAINIKRNGKIDHNFKKGFIFSLYDDKGKLIPGSNASKGYFYDRMAYEYEVANNSNLELIKSDLDQYPYLKKDWDATYASLLNSHDKLEAVSYIEERIQYYKEEESADEETLSNLVALYKILQDQVKADSIQEIIIKKFPTGPFVKRYHLSKFYQASDLSEKEKMFELYHAKFPDETNYKNHVLANLGILYAAQEDFQNFDKFSDLISDISIKANLYNHIANTYIENEKELERAAILSSMALEFLDKIDNSSKPVYFTEKQYQRHLKFQKRMYKDTYAQILFNQGKIKQALELQKEIINKVDNSQYNERYLEYLLANEEFETAVSVASDFIAANAVGSSGKEFYKIAYGKVHGSILGFEDSLTELERKGANKTKMELHKELVSEDASDFVLTDLDGNELSLSSLKGKTVVLDFWATWCRPCIDAFPGMQLAVDKYKDDKDVRFLFINTFEKGESLNTKIKELLEKNSYTFYVLMDRDSDEGRKYITAKDYDVNAIPTKIIIGPDGRLKYKKVGSNDTPEAVAQELETLIDLLKNQTETASYKANN